MMAWLTGVYASKNHIPVQSTTAIIYLKTMGDANL